MTDSHLTIGELAKFFGEPTWKIRRIVDRLDVELPRAGNYRLIPRSLLGQIALKLQPRAEVPA